MGLCNHESLFNEIVELIPLAKQAAACLAKVVLVLPSKWYMRNQSCIPECTRISDLKWSATKFCVCLTNYIHVIGVKCRGTTSIFVSLCRLCEIEWNKQNIWSSNVIIEKHSITYFPMILGCVFLIELFTSLLRNLHASDTTDSNVSRNATCFKRSECLLNTSHLFMLPNVTHHIYEIARLHPRSLSKGYVSSARGFGNSFILMI